MYSNRNTVYVTSHILNLIYFEQTEKKTSINGSLRCSGVTLRSVFYKRGKGERVKKFHMDYSNHGWVCSLPASKLNAIVNENFRDNIQSIKLTD